MQEGLSASVVGPSTIFPRGFLWLAPVYYLAALAGLAAARWLPFWYKLTAAGGLLLAMGTFACVLGVISTRSFLATPAGIRLGLPPSTRRRGRRRRQPKYLPWTYVEKVRIGPRRRGARLEIILIADAPLALCGFRHGPAWRGFRALLLLIPFWYLLRPTGITCPLDNPSRYRLRLRGTTVEEFRHEIRAIAPADVTVAVLVRRRASVSSATSAPGMIDPAAYRAAGWH